MKPKYKVGDRVKIKDELLFNLSDHPAQKYAGTVMTVREVKTFPSGNLKYYIMEEDQGENYGLGWAWYDKYIAGYAADFEDPEPIDDSAFPQITFEQMLAGSTREQLKPIIPIYGSR